SFKISRRGYVKSWKGASLTASTPLQWWAWEELARQLWPRKLLTNGSPQGTLTAMLGLLSQSYKVGDPLKTMIRQFYKPRKEPYPSEVNAMDGEELIEKCRNFLQEKSILLCSMMYGKKTSGEVQYALFGNDKSGGIMVTTRNRNVAEFCKTSALVHVQGFVKQQQQQNDATAEDVARQSLTQLINKNLGHVELVDFDGVVRDELFFQTSPTQLTNLNQTARHISIQNIGSNNLSSTIRSSKAHSIIFFEVKEFPKSLLMSIFANFKLLKELDFEGAPLDRLPEELGNLLHLKYLGVRDTKVKALPKSLSELHKLETLDLKRSRVHQLPFEINKLSNLKHFIAYSDANFQIRQGRVGKVEESKKVGNHQPKIRRWDALCNAIEQMSLHQSLQIISAKKEEPLQLQSMSSPLLLYCLRLQGRLEKLPHWISDLKCLVRIRLLWSQLSEIPLNILAELPKLLELFLYKGCNGTQLHFESGYSPAVRILILEKLDS
ncbi:hypothetical protein Golax_000069, partial [Gossypium laxum]|nr:hypothetical protein [Gossypium laxum]